MARILTGIQSTGVPHLGNLLGAIEPAVEMANKSGNETYAFIADMHSLTSIRDPEIRKKNTLGVAAGWMAFGLDLKTNVFYRQSDVPEVTELMWYLGCFASYSMLTKAHSFKDKADRVENVNAGLFTYPLLMAADILLFDADVVPVGKDQKQHLEMTRDMAQRINHHYGKDILKPPEPKIDEALMTVPGIDGQKMSKSYNNYINIFQSDKKLRKEVMKVVTDTKGLEDPKDPDTCNVFQLYKIIAPEEQVKEMEANYRKGGYGYGHAKQALFDALVERFGAERERFDHYMRNVDEVEESLLEGARKAREVGQPVLESVREVLGYGNLENVAGKPI